MNENAPAQAPDTVTPATVTRYAILLRDPKGLVECMGQLYRDEPTATTAAQYWQSVSPNGESAEIVSLQVPTAGKPIPEARDLFSGGSTDER